MSDAAIELAEAIAKFVRRDISITLPGEHFAEGRQTAREALVALLDAHVLERTAENRAEWEQAAGVRPNEPECGAIEPITGKLCKRVLGHVEHSHHSDCVEWWPEWSRAEEKSALPEADDDEAWTALMRKVYPDGRRSALFIRQLDAAFGTIGILRADLARSNMVNRSHEQRERVDAKVMQRLKDENDDLRKQLFVLSGGVLGAKKAASG